MLLDAKQSRDDDDDEGGVTGLTTNLGRPVPPAFPTKIPELASKVRGRAVLVKATRRYSSQSM